MHPCVSDILAWCAGKRLEREEAERKISATGLSPLFEQQTPAVLSSLEITEDVLGHLRDILIFAKYNRYMRLAGLAANQLGKDGERVMLNACLINRGLEGGWVVALNPEIVSTEGGSRNNTEGCLTWPKKQIRAIRYDTVNVVYTDVEGGHNAEHITGFEALVWQHEINHLRGVPETVIDPHVKVKPNAPCSCGSGKKAKKCCHR